MQVFYCGLPGSGKSHEMVRTEVLPAVQAGRMVVTNIPLQLEKLYEDYPSAVGLVHVLNRQRAETGKPSPATRFSAVEDYTDFADWRHPQDPGLGPVFIVDEAHKPLPPAGKGKVSAEILEFFKEHRHYGVKIVLAAQQFADVEESTRELSEYDYGMKQLGFLGSTSRFWRRTYFGPVAPQKGRKPDSVERRKYDKKIFTYYKSHMHGGGLVKESIQRVWFLKKRWLAVLLACVYFMWSSFGFMDSDEPEAPVKAVSEVSAPAAMSGADKAPEEEEPEPHPWRGLRVALAGFIQVGDGPPSYLLMVDGRRLPVQAAQLLGYNFRAVEGGVMLTHGAEMWFLGEGAPWQLL